MDGDIRQDLGRFQIPFDAILQGQSEEEIIHLVDKKLLSKLRDYGFEPISLILNSLEIFSQPDNKAYSLRKIFESILTQNPIPNNRARDCAKGSHCKIFYTIKV